MKHDRFEAVAAQWNFNPFVIEMFREFADTYHQTVPLSSKSTLLDIGGGTGLIAFDLAESVESVTIVDSSQAMVVTATAHLAEQNIANVSILHSDLLDVDLHKESFDGAYAHMSLHHIENIEKAFGKIYDLLKLGGTIAIGDLVTEDGSFHRDNPVPHNGFDTEAVTKLLKQIGFSSIVVIPMKQIKRPQGETLYERFFLTAIK